MRLTLRTRGSIPPEAAELAGRRLHMAVGRFAGAIRSLTILLADVNGPRGGRDKRCRVQIRLSSPRRPIVIEALADAFPDAIGEAADRASRAVARGVELTRWRREAFPAEGAS